MTFLNTKSFFKYYNSILNNTLVKSELKNLSFAAESHVFDVEEKDKFLTENDILIGIVQTNAPATNNECFFPLFDFYGQPCATIFYREYNSDNLLDNIYICKDDCLNNVKSYITNNPFNINLEGYAYPKFLNEIVNRFESKDNTSKEQQILKIINQTSLFLSARHACANTLKSITNLQRTKHLEGRLQLKQIVEKKEHEVFIRKVYLDTKLLTPTKFIKKYDPTNQKTKGNEPIK